MLGVLADLGPLEVAGYASHRYFTAFTDAGREYKDASQQDSDSFAGEVARAFMTREGHFGRGSAQFIYFPKNNSSFLRLGVNMGIFEFGDSPWLLRLNTHIYFPVRVEQSWTYSVQVEIGQTVSQLANSRWRLGLFLGWTYKTREETFFPDKGNLTDTLRLEHMLFSIGPWLEYATNYYNLKVGLPWRVWLDKESALANDGTRIFHYPSDTKLPDLQVNLSLYF